MRCRALPRRPRRFLPSPGEPDSRDAASPVRHRRAGAQRGGRDRPDRREPPRPSTIREISFAYSLSPTIAPIARRSVPQPRVRRFWSATMPSIAVRVTRSPTHSRGASRTVSPMPSWSWTPTAWSREICFVRSRAEWKRVRRCCRPITAFAIPCPRGVLA